MRRLSTEIFRLRRWELLTKMESWKRIKVKKLINRTSWKLSMTLRRKLRIQLGSLINFYFRQKSRRLKRSESGFNCTINRLKFLIQYLNSGITFACGSSRKLNAILFPNKHRNARVYVFLWSFSTIIHFFYLIKDLFAIRPETSRNMKNKNNIQCLLSYQGKSYRFRILLPTNSIVIRELFTHSLLFTW